MRECLPTRIGSNQASSAWHDDYNFVIDYINRIGLDTLWQTVLYCAQPKERRRCNMFDHMTTFRIRVQDVSFVGMPCRIAPDHR